MEELYIQIRDGQPHEHPIFADNFRQAFPDIDVNNLPLDRFAKFIRVEPPTPGTYEVYEGATYQWVEGVVTDVHIVRPMTDEERAAKDAKLAELALMQAQVEADTRHKGRTGYCQQRVEETNDPYQKQLWLDCLTAHEAWVLEGVDPITPAFPRFPVKDEAGNWVAP